MTRSRLMVAIVAVTAVVVALALSPLGRDAAFHVAPMAWSSEPQSLADAIGLRPGEDLAEIGAGSGGLVVELARLAGPRSRIYATERTAEQRQAIASRAARAQVAVTVVEAPDLATNLPDACCDAIVMRLVLHHIADARRYAPEIRRALKPGGRLAIIDFAPGALPHLTGDHGIGADVVRAAFLDAGYAVRGRVDDWGGRTYLLVLTRTP